MCVCKLQGNTPATYIRALSIHTGVVVNDILPSVAITVTMRVGRAHGEGAVP